MINLNFRRWRATRPRSCVSSSRSSMNTGMRTLTSSHRDSTTSGGSQVVYLVPIYLFNINEDSFYRLELDDVNECFELIKNMVIDTPAEPFFLSILQHMLCIRDDVQIRYT